MIIKTKKNEEHNNYCNGADCNNKLRSTKSYKRDEENREQIRNSEK